MTEPEAPRTAKNHDRSW